MPRHRLDFVLDGAPFYVLYGWQATLGFWGELRCPGRRKPLSEYGLVWPGYRHDAPLQGLLEYLVEAGALDATAVDEALLAQQSPVPVRLSKRGRLALQVIETLKKEAD